MPKWARNKGKPYIRRANGKEKAGTLKDAYKLAFYRLTYGPRGFYVMKQRKSGPEIMACGLTKRDIKRSILVVQAGCMNFATWANKMKRQAQGQPL